MDYQLLHVAQGYKLERFGSYTIARPEPQAWWSYQYEIDDFKRLSDAFFQRKSLGVLSNKEDSGNWEKKNKLLDSWEMEIGRYSGFEIKAKLALTSFKHVGIFPEQYDNWNQIHALIIEQKKSKDSYKVLNLFGYTGLASLVACAAGAKVTHVDSVKQVVTWANYNRVLSGLPNTISWVIEDAPKFVQKEVNRQNSYDLIILDPPSYGRGPKGEKWVLEDNLFDLLSSVKKLLTSNGVVLINLYANHLSMKNFETLLRHLGLFSDSSTCSEQYLTYDNFNLALGYCAWIRDLD
ncbi:MAG: class I SAM-dependent methyltransferase [Chitinophagales bacterium]|jgi:23S rRNA (cytosine1962-C5)-methyltransferase|nr:class I SAM-dependent methyltransferase [Chitinophagales bacterium]